MYEIQILKLVEVIVIGDDGPRQLARESCVLQKKPVQATYNSVLYLHDKMWYVSIARENE